MSSFRALRVEKVGDENYSRNVVVRDTAELPAGELLIDVAFSSLNYKDALSAIGNRGVTRHYPHTPGVDAAGYVLESSADHFSAGDSVIVTGYDLGMNTAGGFGQRIRVPAEWAIPIPLGLDLKSSMILGTAGLTAGLCVKKLELLGMTNDNGPILVTGSTGGVGSLTVKLLSHLGYEVHAVTGKDSQHGFLRRIGAHAILSRQDFLQGSKRALLEAKWGGLVDTVGGSVLFNAVKSLRYGASAAVCGLVASAEFPATVFPFILRNVNVLGIDSVELPLAQKAEMWERLAGPWRFGELDELVVPFSLDTVSGGIDRILAGDMIGRGLVDLRV